MEELKSRLQVLLSDRLYQIIISNPQIKKDITKVKIRPVQMKDGLFFQETVFRGTQVFHENCEVSRMLDKIMNYMAENFRQLEAEGMDGKLTALVSKKGKVTVKYQTTEKRIPANRPELSHNRAKKYILEEGVPVPFLIDLGVQTPEGRIVHARYDKFKQINRYLEFVEDILPELQKKDKLHIVDFGCGKSYLTFALYYYLHELKGLDVQITGLDLKEDVIEHCGRLAEVYGYEGLRFLMGDISTFQGPEEVDMVVTLHACDTATDYALFQAISWNAGIIFSVPCCQHEVNGQLENDLWQPVLRYGLLKERIAALLTDGIRANLLEEAGYETQVLEFIDMEHTPKNILLRAIKRKTPAESGENSGIRELTEALHINNTLQRLLIKEDKNKPDEASGFSKEGNLI